MTNQLYRTWVHVISVAVLAACATLLQAQVSTTAPTTQRSRFAIEADLSAAARQFNEALSDRRVFASVASRQAAARKAVPALDRAIQLQRELLAFDSPERAKFRLAAMTLFDVLKLALDDPATSETSRQAVASGGANGAEAQAIKAAADYLDAGQNASAQLRAIEEYRVAATGIEDEGPVWYLPGVFSRNPPATSAVAAKLVAVLSADVRNPEAQSVAQTMASPATIARLRAMNFPWYSFQTPADADTPGLRARRSRMENKPLIIQGALVDGSAFSTAKWKGKVVLVDFWATTCGPCLGELPGLERLYTNRHSDGLEILGISADDSVDRVQTYLANHPEMNWHQAFDRARPGFDAIFNKYNIGSLPAVFLIDRKGFLRHEILGHDENLETLVTQLLAESP